MRLRVLCYSFTAKLFSKPLAKSAGILLLNSKIDSAQIFMIEEQVDEFRRFDAKEYILHLKRFQNL